ncbi:acyltransferase family protein [Streptomyces sp. NPDC059743]|uniref:acyltransferase family protein n=1 Tax=Streptomyces sp. NPDC059743 TaxID=3346928 RepID=UPI003653396F
MTEFPPPPATELPRLATPRQSTAAHLRLDIQGLRALAVSLVILSHIGVARFSGGYVGVDVFFVISGFVITSMLLRELSSTGRLSIRTFYARRALRLLPAATVVVIATLAGSWLYLSRVRFADYVGDALSSSLYAANIRLASTGTDYLSQGSPPSPFQHFWSLAVEEQFYLVWPLLLLVSWTVARRHAFPLALPTAVLTVVSFALSLLTTATSPSWAYFGPHTRAWELGTGSLLAMAATRLEKLPARIAAAATWTGLACVLIAAFTFDQDTPFPGYHALLPVLGTALVLAGGCVPTRFGARRLLALRPAVWVGGLSYGWYLWHWPLLVIGPMALRRSPELPLLLALMAVALPAAWATSRLVENPVRFHPVLRRRPGSALGVGAGLSAGAVSLVLLAGTFPPAIDSGVPAPVLQNALRAAPDAEGRLAELLGSAPARLPSNLTPGLDAIRSKRSAAYRDGCHANYTGTSAPPCVFGDRASDKVVVLFGDSHAAQWFPALDRLARARHWRLVSLTKASCKAATVTTVLQHKPYRSCDIWRNDVLARIDRLRPFLVIVSSSDAGTLVDPELDPLQEWTAGYRRTFQRLTATGAQVVALLDTPWPKSDPVDCAASYPLRLTTCATDTATSFRDPIRREATRAAAASSGVSVIDPEPWFCAPDGDCPVVVDDTLVYRDDSHVAETYAQALAPVVGDRLSRTLAGRARAEGTPLVALRPDARPPFGTGRPPASTGRSQAAYWWAE